MKLQFESFHVTTEAKVRTQEMAKNPNLSHPPVTAGFPLQLCGAGAHQRSTTEAGDLTRASTEAE